MSSEFKKCVICERKMLKGLHNVCSYQCQLEKDKLKPKKDPKPRACAECKKQTMGRNKYCSDKCSKKASKRRIKAKGGTLPQAKKKAWTEFSKFIRARDGKCVTCGATENLQAGHFIKASQCYNYFNFNEINVNAQCYRCNVALDGNYIEYTMFMIGKYGADIFDKLKAENLSYKEIKPSQSGYLELRDKYKI